MSPERAKRVAKLLRALAADKGNAHEAAAAAAKLMELKEELKEGSPGFFGWEPLTVLQMIQAGYKRAFPGGGDGKKKRHYLLAIFGQLDPGLVDDLCDQLGTKRRSVSALEALRAGSSSHAGLVGWRVGQQIKAKLGEKR